MPVFLLPTPAPLLTDSWVGAEDIHFRSRSGDSSPWSQPGPDIWEVVGHWSHHQHHVPGLVIWRQNRGSPVKSLQVFSCLVGQETIFCLPDFFRLRGFFPDSTIRVSPNFSPLCQYVHHNYCTLKAMLTSFSNHMQHNITLSNHIYCWLAKR